MPFLDSESRKHKTKRSIGLSIFAWWTIIQQRHNYLDSLSFQTLAEGRLYTSMIIDRVRSMLHVIQNQLVLWSYLFLGFLDFFWICGTLCSFKEEILLMLDSFIFYQHYSTERNTTKVKSKDFSKKYELKSPSAGCAITRPTISIPFVSITTVSHSLVVFVAVPLYVVSILIRRAAFPPDFDAIMNMLYAPLHNLPRTSFVLFTGQGQGQGQQ